jgi:hypothetical protein
MPADVATFTASPAGLSISVKKMRFRRKTDIWNITGGADSGFPKFQNGTLEYYEGVFAGIVDQSAAPSPGIAEADSISGELTFNVGGVGDDVFTGTVLCFDLEWTFDFERQGAPIIVVASWKFDGAEDPLSTT